MGTVSLGLPQVREARNLVGVGLDPGSESQSRPTTDSRPC